MAFVALGSNLGNSVDIIARAFAQLQSLSSQPILQSSLWQSTPVDCPPGSPLFVNGVAGLVPLANEIPLSLLRKLRGMEQQFGRQPKKILNEPRVLDLDLIAFGAETMKTADLVLPHPRAHLRKFVLQPLGEIAPDLVLPGQTQTVLELLRGMNTTEELKKL